MTFARSLFTLLLFLSLGPQVDAQATRRRPSGQPYVFTFTYKLIPERTTRNVLVRAAIPRTIGHWQTIEKITFSHKPSKQYTKGDGKYAEFAIDELKGAQTITITIAARLQSNDWAGMYRRRRKTKPPAPAMQETSDEKYIESKDETIKAIASRIRGGSRIVQVRNIVSYVAGQLRKTRFNPKDIGAVKALKAGHGDCTEYTDLFVALCRAKGIPARFVEGYVSYMPARGDTAKHNWGEVYFDKIGWVAFDPLHVDLRKATATKIYSPGLKLTGTRNDDELDGHHFYMYRFGNGKMTVRDGFSVRKAR